MFLRRITQITSASIMFCCSSFVFAEKHNAYSYLKQLISVNYGIGVRTSGSLAEKRTAKFISKTLTELGDTSLATITLGAHYDSKGDGSYGAIDNGTGAAAMLEIAGIISKSPPKYYNIRFIAFGSEKISISG